VSPEERRAFYAAAWARRLEKYPEEAADAVPPGPHARAEAWRAGPALHRRSRALKLSPAEPKACMHGRLAGSPQTCAGPCSAESRGSALCDKPCLWAPAAARRLGAQVRQPPRRLGSAEHGPPRRHGKACLPRRHAGARAQTVRRLPHDVLDAREDEKVLASGRPLEPQINAEPRWRKRVDPHRIRPGATKMVLPPEEEAKLQLVHARARAPGFRARYPTLAAGCAGAVFMTQ